MSAGSGGGGGGAWGAVGTGAPSFGGGVSFGGSSSDLGSLPPSRLDATGAPSAVVSPWHFSQLDSVALSPPPPPPPPPPSSSSSSSSSSSAVRVVVVSAAVAASLAAAVWWYGRDLPPHLRYRPGTMSGWVAGLLEGHAKRRRSRRPVRVYMDGCFDLMHYGHANALRQARALGDQLVVGLIPDSEILRCKGPPVLREAERLSLVEGVKWVDEVIRGVPYDLTPAFLDELFTRHRIDYVLHGDDPCLLPDGTDAYAHAKRLGRFRVIKRTEGVSTTELVGRMLMCTRDARRQADGEGGLAMSLTRDFSVGSASNAAKGDALKRLAEALGKDDEGEGKGGAPSPSPPSSLSNAAPAAPAADEPLFKATQGTSLRHPPSLSSFSAPPPGGADEAALGRRSDGGESENGEEARRERARTPTSAPIGIPGAAEAHDASTQRAAKGAERKEEEEEEEEEEAAEGEGADAVGAAAKGGARDPSSSASSASSSRPAADADAAAAAADAAAAAAAAAAVAAAAVSSHAASSLGARRSALSAELSKQAVGGSPTSSASVAGAASAGALGGAQPSAPSPSVSSLVASPADRVRVSRFMPTSRRIVQFSSGRAPPPGGRVAYVDGAFDLFHPGHVEALRAARSACDFLLVGVHADADVSARRGQHEPILDVHERALSVLACRFADEVIIGAPLVVSEDLLTSFNVAVVLRGTVHETESAEDVLRKRRGAQRLVEAQQTRAKRSGGLAGRAATQAATAAAASAAPAAGGGAAGAAAGHGDASDPVAHGAAPAEAPGAAAAASPPAASAPAPAEAPGAAPSTPRGAEAAGTSATALPLSTPPASLRSPSTTVPATYLPSAHMVPEVMASGAAPPPPSAPAPTGALLLDARPEDLSPLDRERYAVPLARGAMLRFRSPCALRAESIIDRILDNRARYEARNKKKVASEANYYEKDKVFVQEL